MKHWIALSPFLLLLTLWTAATPQRAWAQEAPAEAVVEVVEAPAEAPGEPSPPIPADELSYAFNTVMMMLFGVLVIFMQAGFALVEAGLNSQKNTVNILFKNLMDFCIGVMLFWLFGLKLMYPGEISEGKAYADESPWIPRIGMNLMVDQDDPPALGTGYSGSADFLFQVAFAATAATIVSGAVAGRLKFSAYLIYSAVLTGLIYPISGFWKWGGGALDQMGFQDFAGSLVVHAVGGFAGLAGAIALGPRIGRFGADGKSHPMPGHNLTYATLGVFILLIGWYGFNPGSQLAYTSTLDARATADIAMMTTLAAAAGAIAAMLLAWGMFGKPDLTMALNGVLAGLVGITANCDRVSQVESVLIGGIAGVLVVLAIVELEKLKIDDPVGAFPVHGVCGVWGGLATGVFGDIPTNDDGSAVFASQAEFFMVQLKCSAIICVWAFVTMAALFFGLKAIGMLRVSKEEEIEGLDIGEHGMQAYTIT